MVPIAEETTTGIKLVSSNSPRSTISSAKNKPAIGALKIAAIAPADPQAINVFLLSSEITKNLLTQVPTTPPIWAIGPSCPALPPSPRVIIEAKILATVCLSFIIPPYRFTVTRKSGNPYPYIFGEKILASTNKRDAAIRGRKGIKNLVTREL